MKIVVSDASPLIGLARINRLTLLKDIFSIVIIPPEVRNELQIGSGKPGEKILASAENDGWIKTKPLSKACLNLSHLDRGEAEAISLALETKANFLIIDERKGRKTAKKHNISVIGIGRILIAAKHYGLISDIEIPINELKVQNYQISDEIIQMIYELSKKLEKKRNVNPLTFNP